MSYIDNIIVEQHAIADRMTYSKNTPSVDIISTTTSGTLNLTVNSKSQNIFTGTALGYSIVLSDATTLVNGWTYIFFNNSSQPVTVKDFSGATLFFIGSLSVGYFTLQNNSTSAGIWAYWQIFSGSTAGLVYYKATTSTVFTTTSLTYVPVTGSSVTPLVGGTYAVWFNGITTQTCRNKAHHFSIFNNGVNVLDSERYQTSSASRAGMTDSTITTISVVAGNIVDVRLYSDTGTSTSMYGRTLILARIAD